MKKKVCFLIILGAVICKYFADKVLREKKYDIEKKNIHIETLNRWLTLRDKGISIERYLKEKNVKKVAIYGLGMIGNHLYEELRQTGTEIVGVDQSDIYNNFQMPVYKPDGCFEDVDLIIVTPLEYDKICDNLKQYNGKIISFAQLLSECEAFLYEAYV